jgi:histidyl-tRNA synthetase
MPKQEQGPLSGFRDMLAEQMIPRQQMIDKIRGVYESYGFAPLDTPAIERQETLTGKYGAEGEKLMYKFADNGGRLIALRYDLTVPLARVVAQHRGEITLPYKRYQVGNVWRGESPQAGRYREFMQFDADTVGTTSAIADAEIVSMMSDTMKALGADAVVRVNNRRILDALCEKAGVTTEADTRKLVGTIDKVEKIGIEAALKEIEESFDRSTALLVESYLGVKGNDFERLTQIEELLGDSPAAQEGISNLEEVFAILSVSGYTDSAVFDQTIARGLDYYTGIIYETTLKDLPKIGSVCSGGRYDKLVKALGGPDLPAVGASVGVDRLFAALQQLGKIESVKTTSKVLVANFDAAQAPTYMKVAGELRKSGIATEVYYDQDKLGKQIKFANKMGIPYMIFMGSEEIEKGLVTVKDLSTGDQKQVSVDELTSLFK